MFHTTGLLLAPLPDPVVTALGGVERDPGTVLALSRLCGGANYFEPRVLKVRGREVHLGTNETWASIDTVRADVNRAAGLSLERHQVRDRLHKLKRRRFLSSRSAVEGARGKYGNVYTLSPDLLTPDAQRDVLKEFRIYAYGDATAFSLGEVANGCHTIRGKYQRADIFRRHVAKSGTDHAAYVGVGRWRTRAEAGDPDAPVFVPWVVVDIDRPHIMDAFEAAHAVLREMEAEGVPLDRAFVSFSGSKGFHVALPSTIWGSPIFRDALSARTTLQRLVERVVGTEGIDPAPLSPLNLVRCTGSVHDSTGLVKRTWPATAFRALSLYDVTEAARSFEPFAYELTPADVEEDMVALFEEAAEEAVEEIRAIRRRARSGAGGLGSTVKRILDGVDEGEQFHDNHVGRNKAAFILSCWLHEGPKQQQAAARYLGIDVPGEPGSDRAAWGIYEWWDLHKNPAPMQNDRDPRDRRGFKHAFESGRRTVGRSHARR